MNFIKKIFDNKPDELIHEQFVRFSVGDYYPRAVLQIKKGSTTKLKSGFEYGNDFIKFLSENTQGEVEIKGKIYSKKDFTSDLVEDKAKKKGFYIGTIKTKIPTTKLKSLYEQFKKDTYLLLNIKGKDFELKIHQTPHNPRGKYKEDFCKLNLKGELAQKIIKEFAFDINTDFKQATLKHRFLIEDIEIPKEFEKDMAMARLMAKRVGKVVRELLVDNRKSKKEAKLKA